MERIIEPAAYVVSCKGWGDELCFTENGAKEIVGRLELVTGKVAEVQKLYSRDDVEYLIEIERAVRTLAYVVRKSLNSGPLSSDPTSEAKAWRSLRQALGETYDEKGNLSVV